MINYLRDAGRYVPIFATSAFLMTSTETEASVNCVMTVAMNSGGLETNRTKSTAGMYLRLMRMF